MNLTRILLRVAILSLVLDYGAFAFCPTTQQVEQILQNPQILKAHLIVPPKPGQEEWSVRNQDRADVKDFLLQHQGQPHQITAQVTPEQGDHNAVCRYTLYSAGHHIVFEVAENEFDF